MERGYTQDQAQSAVVLQSLYRTCGARREFHLLMTSVVMMKTCEQDYLLAEPEDLTTSCNYVLYLHVIHVRCMIVCQSHGSHGVSWTGCGLYSIVIYWYVTREEDLETIVHLITRAKAVDMPYVGTAASANYRASIGYFRHALILS